MFIAWGLCARLSIASESPQPAGSAKVESCQSACSLRAAELEEIQQQALSIRQQALQHTLSSSELTHTKNAEAEPKIQIFVSLSMPNDSLKQLYQAATQHPAVLVLRGLLNNSFQETQHKLQDLGIAVHIDPRAFERYQIEAVPAFIFQAPQGRTPIRLQGNVRFAFALEQAQEAGYLE